MAEIRLRYTKKGQKRYLANVRTIGRKTISKTFARKTDAERWIMEIEQAKLNDGAKYSELRLLQKQYIYILT